MGDQEIDVWTEFDIRDLKNYFKIFGGKYKNKPEKIIQVLAFKLRRSEDETQQKMKELNMIPQNIIGSTISQTHDIIIPTTQLRIKTKCSKEKNGEVVDDLGSLTAEVKNQAAYIKQLLKENIDCQKQIAELTKTKPKIDNDKGILRCPYCKELFECYRIINP